MSTNNVLLSSGGMDTFLLAHELAHNGVNAMHLFVDVGQPYAQKEQAAAMYVASTVGAPFQMAMGAQMGRFEHDSGIIPFRNAELILCAAQHGGNHIYIGVIADEVNSDKSPEFMHAMTAVLNISHRPQYWTQGREFHIRTPLRDRCKSALVADYLRRGGFVAPLLGTVSCYNASAQHCGRCASCFKRWVALVNNRIKIPADHFVQNPAMWRTRSQWQQAAAGYTDSRRAEVFRALDLAEVR
jgi:7-cyano-7-deazaguanine synthase